MFEQTISEETPIYNSFLSQVFNFFSLLFAFSFIGLAINLIINFEFPYTHLYFVGTMICSLFFGTFVNVVDKWWFRLNLQFEIEAIFNKSDIMF